MITNHQFYNQTLRRYIVMFGDMFNGMVVQRIDSSETKIQTIGVPITYSPKEKFLARTMLDPNLDRPIQVQLPQIAFEMISMTYDGSRRLSSVQQNKKQNPTVSGSIYTQYTPVPWNMTFALYLFVRNADDGAQLMEQIIPFFGPEWTNSVNLIPSMGIKYDIPTILNDVSIEDAYEGDFITRRAMIYTLTFTVKGYFFGPVKTTGPRNKVIKKIRLDFGVPKSTFDIDGTTLDFSITDEEVLTTGRTDRVILTPGLLANGSPTTNSAASINYQLISANSNFGVCSNTFFYLDGLKFNPAKGQDE